MADTLKTFFSATLVRRLAADLTRVHPTFPSDRFVKAATAGLSRLELLDRGRHIARVMAAHLPSSYPEAIDVLLRSLGPEHTTDELIGVGMAPFFYLPHTLYVADRGLDHFELSMRAQYELTKRFSAESSIRPYIARDPERAFAMLRRWTFDTSAHVRRLVSEGTRLRLPWAPRVAWLDAHPERVLELLELLKDDPSTMVRRSVANNLNDLGKARPDLLIRTATVWLEQASANRRALVEHALRSAVKRGDPGALALLGYGRKPAVRLERVRFAPRRVRIGQKMVVTFSLRSTTTTPQDLLVDMAVHFVKATGKTSAKVFKITRSTLGPRQRIDLKANLSLAVHTTRVPQPGRHAVDVIVNGHTMRAGSFDVLRARPPVRRGVVSAEHGRRGIPARSARHGVT
jgi:3-methyladenine DNA glycosylase AlkC